MHFHQAQENFTKISCILRENERTDLRLTQIESDIARLQSMDPSNLYCNKDDLLKYDRNIEMLQDKIRNIDRLIDSVNVRTQNKVNSVDFFAFTSKAAKEYVTVPFLDMTIENIYQKIQKSDRPSATPVLTNKQHKGSQINILLNDDTQLDDKLERLKVELLAQISYKPNSVDVLKPFRDQMTNQINQFYDKLHQLELNQAELARHQKVSSQYEAINEQIIGLQEQIRSLKISSSEQQKEILELKNTDQSMFQRIDQIQKSIDKVQYNQVHIVKMEQLNELKTYIDQQFQTNSKGCEHLLRINKLEDSLLQQINSGELLQLKTVVNNLQLDLINQENQLSTKIQQLSIKLITETGQCMQEVKSRVIRSELFEILDNQHDNLKTQAIISNLSEKYKDLFQRQIELIECSFRFDLQNQQSANASESDKSNQKLMLLKRCEALRNALSEQFGLGQQNNQQFSQLEQKHNISESQVKERRPNSVSMKRNRLQLNSGTPKTPITNRKIRSMSQHQVSQDAQFFHKVIQNPLVARLRK